MKISPILQKIAKHYGLFRAENSIMANRQKSDLMLGVRIDDLPVNRRDGLCGFYMGSIWCRAGVFGITGEAGLR
jgi:hypothetical protein